MGLLLRTALVLTTCTTPLLSGIIVDGLADDWPTDAVEQLDVTGDGQGSSGDFTKVRVTNDAYNLYILVEFDAPLNLRTADLRLLIDADNDATTGTPYSGRGMDFSWDFDRIRGTSTLTSRGDIGRGNLIERMAPDGSSKTHEFAVSLEALPAVRDREPVHIALIEENSSDRIPDTGSAIAYTVQGPLSVQPMPIDVAKDSRSIRIVSWNVLRDAPFKNNNSAAFIRILTALQPDIVMFQEIYNTSTEEVRSYFVENLQIGAESQWEATRTNDCITVSRFPILGGWSSDGNLVSRHDTAEILGSNLLIANAHLPCCTSGESGRVRESQNILNLVEARLNETTEAPQTVLIGGDLNSGGLAPELILLTSGLLPLEMASPRHVYEFDQYTWGSDGTSSFGSSRLDFLLFDPTTLLRDKAFILDTDVLPSEALDDLKLEAADTFISDHLVLVFDVRSPDLPDYLNAAPMQPDGSTVSEWLGPINGLEYPYIEHETFGGIHLFESEDGVWFTPDSGSWSWTNPDSYPWVWKQKS